MVTELLQGARSCAGRRGHGKSAWLPRRPYTPEREGPVYTGKRSCNRVWYCDLTGFSLELRRRGVCRMLSKEPKLKR